MLNGIERELESLWVLSGNYPAHAEAGLALVSVLEASHALDGERAARWRGRFGRVIGPRVWSTEAEQSRAKALAALTQVRGFGGASADYRALRIAGALADAGVVLCSDVARVDAALEGAEWPVIKINQLVGVVPGPEPVDGLAVTYVAKFSSCCAFAWRSLDHEIFPGMAFHISDGAGTAYEELEAVSEGSWGYVRFAPTPTEEQIEVRVRGRTLTLTVPSS